LLADEREYFTNHTSYEKLKDAYIEFTTKFITLLGATTHIEKSVADLYNFEQKLAKVSLSLNRNWLRLVCL